MLVEAPTPEAIIPELINPADCVTLPYDPLRFPWSRIGRAVMEMERFNFKQHAEPEEKLAGIFADPQSIITIVSNPVLGHDIVGFSAVVHALREYTFPDWEFPDRLSEESADLQSTAYVHCTQLAKPYQGKRLVIPLNDVTLQRITSAGYTHAERDAANTRRAGKTETYAEQLARTYRDQVTAFTPHPSKFGPQAFIRMSLVHPASMPRSIIH